VRGNRSDEVVSCRPNGELMEVIG